MTVADVALLLEVVAGRDPLDPRQRDVVTMAYTEALGKGVDGLTFGVVREGFGWEGASEEDVDAAVRQAAERFRNAGGEGDGSLHPHAPGRAAHLECRGHRRGAVTDDSP